MKNKNIDHISDQCVCLQQTVWTFFFLFFFFSSLFIYIYLIDIYFLFIKSKLYILSIFFPSPPLSESF